MKTFKLMVVMVCGFALSGCAVGAASLVGVGLSSAQKAAFAPKANQFKKNYVKRAIEQKNTSITNNQEADKPETQLMTGTETSQIRE